MEPMRQNQKRKIMLCGDGPVIRELLKRMGQLWRVTLVGSARPALEKAAAVFDGEVAVVEGDPSSPLVLQQAGMEEQDYLLALAADDQVNLAVAQAGREAKVPHVLCLYSEAVNQPLFRQLGVEALLASGALARQLHQFLENPGVRATPLALCRGAVLEMNTSELPQLVGRKARSVRTKDWSLVGLIRGEELVLLRRETRIKLGDRLVILGQPDMFGRVCTDLDCNLAGFPLAWGHTLLVALTPNDPDEHERVLNEGLFWALNSKVEETIILCRQGQSDFQHLLNEWPSALQVRVETVERNLLARARQICEEEKVGLAVLGKFEPTLLGSLARSALMDLAESLGSPVVLSGGTSPYGGILVPFNGSPRAELALEVACEVARLTGGELSAALVEEPQFIRGGDTESWLQKAQTRARDLAHAHKLSLKQVVLQGNPVRQISALSKDFDLLVVGGSSRGRGLLSPNVGEHLAQKAACSVLLVAEKG